MNPITSLLFLLLSISATLPAQNWSTFGSSSLRNGRTEIAGPESVSQAKWTVTSAATTLGNAVYSFGDRFVTSRITFSPYKGKIECRNLQTGALLWTSPNISNSSILYATGFTQDAVYAHDYATDSIYALYPETGQIKWRSSRTSHTFGAYPGFVFACNGDPILNGPITQGVFTMRLDKNTGEPLWTNPTIIAIGPSAVLAARDERVYRITGGITVPIVITAIDAQTGQNLYNSAPIPGDGDQENPLCLGDQGEVYFWRDGGKLYAYKDNGAGFDQLWAYTPATTTGAALSGNISLDNQGNLYVFDASRVKRINRVNGTVMAESMELNMSQPSLTIDGDSTVIVNTGMGQFIAFRPDLQAIKWQLTAPNNVYCNPAPAKDGIMVVTFGGAQIRAYQSEQNRAPVADFAVANAQTQVGTPVAFQDQSSYQPDSWNWFFEGGDPTTSTLPNPVVTYAQTGVYDVLLVVENALGVDTIRKSCLVNVIPGSSAQTEPGIPTLQLFPNPASETVSMGWPEEEQALRCTITDLTGQIISQQAVYHNAPTLNVQSLHPGYYLLAFQGKTGRWIARLVIQR
ncbi:MAG TPA: PQQ-binding-like beta-propeller repeat protein [Saprospiraceae bacterium]|nr:PQQ-binding-like beta-propeller repeat protein [Saprospiraceae bacterium]